MQKFGQFICRHAKNVMIVTCILIVLSVIGMTITGVNYDILVYLPEDIETIKGQDILTDDFAMGAYSIATVENATNKDIIKLEESIKTVEGVNKVVSLYDVLGTTVPLEMLPNEITSKLHSDNTDLLFITFEDSTSAKTTLDAVEEIRSLSNGSLKLGGMSSMVLDTMNLSNREITVYVVIAVILCLLVLEFSLDSYLVPVLLLLNIGVAILFNLGSNVFLGEISYITKALVAVLQLGVTTDFSIFLYHSYEAKKKTAKSKETAMVEAIKETFTSVTGSSLTTIAGFLVLATMKLTLGKDLGIVMAKGVLLGVITVLTVFPSLLLLCDRGIEKTKHKKFVPNFELINDFIVEHHIAIFVAFILLLYPAFMANKKVDVYYKMDKSLPDTLESIMTNEGLKEKFSIVSPEIILLDRNLKNDDVESLADELKSTKGIDLVLSFSKIKDMGITEEMLSEDIEQIFETERYQMVLINSLYDIASDELNEQVGLIGDIVKKYDKNAIVAGEGPLMKDLIEISDRDFKNVNYSSIICIFLILFIVLKSLSLPVLLITAIEFAIFMNMGISYFGGVTLPFVAPIVLGTIQLGATIDYAILITTTYLEKRKSGLAKKEAMLETMKSCDNSIFVSGLCFFAATFGVGIYSDLEMVGSLCTLISRGAIVSMLSVITILPSILLLADKPIMKTTLGTRKEKNMKIKNKMAIVAIAIGSILLPLNAKALEKEETVYAKLDYDGKVKYTLVNEHLKNDMKLDTIEDFSDLSDIINIHNDLGYQKTGDKLLWEARGKDIFYRGLTEKSLPVEVEISYKLDGKSIELEDLLGKKGEIMITLQYKNLDSHIVQIAGHDERLYTPFTVILATSLDTNTNSNIEVSNGKIVTNGSKSFALAYAMPGLYESLKLEELKDIDTITITYETEDFSLPSMYSIITPDLLEKLDDSKIYGELDTLLKSTDELKKNIDIIEDGSKTLKKGADELKTSLKKSIDAMSSTNNTSSIDEKTLNSIVEMAQASVRKAFTDEYRKSIADKAWMETSASLNPNDENVITIVSESVTNAVVDYLKSVNEYGDYVNCEQGKKAVAMGGSMTSIEMNSCQVIANDLTLPIVQNAALKSAKEATSKTSTYVAEKVSKSVAIAVAEETSLKTSIEVAKTLAPLLADEVKNASLKAISGSMGALYDGVDALDRGIGNLTEGISEYNEKGITKLSDTINNRLGTTANRIEALSKLGKDYSTFTKTGDNPSDTKFIFVIDSKKSQHKETQKFEEQKKTSFIDRLIHLFD